MLLAWRLSRSASFVGAGDVSPLDVFPVDHISYTPNNTELELQTSSLIQACSLVKALDLLSSTVNEDIAMLSRLASLFAF